MMEIEIDGRPTAGTPLLWSDRRIEFLERDGRLSSFAPHQARNFRKSTTAFRGLTPGELRGQLLAEFDSRFDVSGTGRYLVVHPRGRGRQWVGRFEEIYRSFVHYFATRGLRIEPPPYPLVAVVFHDAAEFSRSASAGGLAVSPSSLGYYEPGSNRVFLYDPDEVGGDWMEGAATIIHEAAHQAAFNTGVHSRFTMPPRWAAEGLATMFEAPGVCSAALHPQAADRINWRLLAMIRRSRKGGVDGDAVYQLIAADRMFRTDPIAAYGWSWALSFFLAETQPKDYARYLAATGSLPPFTRSGSRERVENFVRHFGEPATVQSRLVRYLDSLSGER